MSRVLIYTVSRANTPQEVERALTSLQRGRDWAGMEHEWILWANAAGILEAAKWVWQGPVRGDGENKGQHIPLRTILDEVMSQYDFIVRVDDDVTWLTKNWLKKLVGAAHTIHEASKSYKPEGVWPVLGPRVRGLSNPIPTIDKLIIAGIPVYLVPILGGICRLHHISFFDGYVADVRQALGAGDATSFAAYASDAGIPMFQLRWVRVQHKTAKMEVSEPGYFKPHKLFQAIPYIPVWRHDDAEAHGPSRVA